MLELTVGPLELWDEEKEEFIFIKQQTLQLEHSLLSLSKWEAKWHKVFLDDKTNKTREEVIDYIRCMTINKNVDPNVYNNLSADDIRKINDYIEDPMSATCFPKLASSNRVKDKNTSELIYYWMIEFGIPFECQKWHINRLLTLIKVCNVKRGGNKMSKRDLSRSYKEINARNRAKFNSKG